LGYWGWGLKAWLVRGRKKALGILRFKGLKVRFEGGLEGAIKKKGLRAISVRF